MNESTSEYLENCEANNDRGHVVLWNVESKDWHPSLQGKNEMIAYALQ